MSRINDDIIPQRKDFFPYVADQAFIIASREIGSSNGAGKKGIPDNNDFVSDQGDASGRMPRGMEYLQGDIPEGDDIPFLQVPVGRRGIVYFDAPHPAAAPLLKDHGSICTVDKKLGSRHFLESFVIRCMVKVTVGVNDVDTTLIFFGESQQYLVRVASRIDDSRLPGPFTAKDVTIRLNGSYDQHFQNHEMSPEGFLSSSLFYLTFQLISHRK
jgi:hypothetical protein